jgi:hypothetical protein
MLETTVWTRCMTLFQILILKSHSLTYIQLSQGTDSTTEGSVAVCNVSTCWNSFMVYTILLCSPGSLYCLTFTAQLGVERVTGYNFASLFNTAFITQTLSWNSPTEVCSIFYNRISIPKMIKGIGSYCYIWGGSALQISKFNNTSLTLMSLPMYPSITA